MWDYIGLVLARKGEGELSSNTLAYRPCFPRHNRPHPQGLFQAFFHPFPPPTPLLVGADEKICSYQLSSFRENCPNKYVTISFLRKSIFWRKF